MRSQGDSTAFARTLAVAYTLLVIYASLHPFLGWHFSGAPLFDFLTARWPRYWTGLDVGLNVAAYLPLGFLYMAVLLEGAKRGRSVLIATLLGLLLSFLMETLQNFLPGRFSSNVDLGTNTLGTFLGAVLGARWGRTLILGGAVHRWRVHRLQRGRLADVGIVLLLAWLLIQVSPEILLFGTGDLRHLLGLEAAFPYSAERFRLLELMVAASGTLGAGLFAWRLIRTPSRALLFGLLAGAVTVRSLSAVILLSPDDMFRWATPGSLSGLAWGLALLLAATFLPRVLQHSCAALALLLATALVNMAPENPYLAHSLSVWRQGHFLNFNGLTRLAAVFWPYLTLAFLVAFGPGRAQRDDSL